MNEINQTSPIVESNNFIVLDKWTKLEQKGNFQSESDLEHEMISDLQQQGYDYVNYLITPESLLGNLRLQLEDFNAVHFSDNEWERLLSEYINKPSDGIIE